jgi:uncharacterized protein (TIRG00374 family)
MCAPRLWWGAPVWYPDPMPKIDFIDERAGRYDDDQDTDADPHLPEIPLRTVERVLLRGQKARMLVKVVVALAIGGGALFVALSAAGGLAGSLHFLKRVEARWIVAAGACELAVYVVLSLHLRYLAGPHANARKLAPFRLSLILFGLGSVLPAAPAEGLVMAGAMLQRRRLARRRAVIVLGLSQWFSGAALYAVAAVDALVVIGLTRLPLPDRSALIAFAIICLISLAALGYFGSRQRVAEWIALVFDRCRIGRPRPSAAESRARGAAWRAAVAHVVSGPGGVAFLLTTASLAWLADAACLHFSLMAIGVHVRSDVLLLAYVAGIVLSMLPLVPAGAGVVETVVPAVLGLAGVPIVAALAAVVLYRMLSTLLPAVLGGLALIGMRLQKPPALPDPGLSPIPLRRDSAPGPG